jgi:hypothetical protein
MEVPMGPGLTPSKRTEYFLTGPIGLNLAEMILIGDPCKGKHPQRRPIVFSWDEYLVIYGGTIGRELDRAIDLLSLGPKERKRRLAILKGLRDKLGRI